MRPQNNIVDLWETSDCDFSHDLFFSKVWLTDVMPERKDGSIVMDRYPSSFNGPLRPTLAIVKRLWHHPGFCSGCLSVKMNWSSRMADWCFMLLHACEDGSSSMRSLDPPRARSEQWDQGRGAWVETVCPEGIKAQWLRWGPLKMLISPQLRANRTCMRWALVFLRRTKSRFKRRPGACTPAALTSFRGN